MTNNSYKLIHAAQILVPKEGKQLLLLRKQAPDHYIWFLQNDRDEESETPISAPTIEESIRLAQKHWKNYFFKTFNCGFRYTLPERDEHGINALLYQMIASYSSPNGIYYEDDLGHNCFINFASDEAKSLWQKLKLQNRL